MGASAVDSVETVRAVMERYTDAVYRADIEALKEVFHPAAFMGGYLGDDLLLGDPAPFFADLEEHPSMAETQAPYQAEIVSVQVDGRIAVATVRETGFFGTVSFINHFTLLLEEGDWRILSKTFATL